MNPIFNRTNFIPVNTAKPFMRTFSVIRFCFLSVILVSLFSCNKKEDFSTEALQDYLPLQTGKYITYRLDSTVFINFGTVTEIHTYQEKHLIDSVFTDNLGHTSYRVFVSQRDEAGTWPWIHTSTYYITPLEKQVEVLDESNFRFIKMHLPLRDGYSWKGNTYLPTNPYSSKFNFSNDDNMADWDYFYDGGPSTFNYQGIDYANVYSVEQADEEYNVPITDPHAYAAKSRAVEKYSKDIGLIYKELILWEYQPNPGGPNPYKTGFGITMWMIDHN